jgi:excisionase family DNA binding protein
LISKSVTAKSSSTNKSVTTMNKVSTAIRGPYLTTAEAAAYLKTSESHFRALVRAGKVTKPIRPYGPTGKCLYSQPQLDELMHASAVEQGVIPPNAA